MSSKREEKIALYTGALEKINVKVDASLLEATTKACGPSIYNADSECVSCSDSAETGRVKDGFLAKKLGVTGAKADEAVAYVCEKMGTSNRKKYRAVFYYLLVEKLNAKSKLK